MMSRLLSSFAVVAFVATLGTAAQAKSCRGANGKFVKCPPAASSMNSTGSMKKDAKGRCHGANGKFVKCK